MSELPRRDKADHSFLCFLLPLALASLPSLLFCALEIALAVHGIRSGRVILFHLPPQTSWDRLLALQSSVYAWVSRWNTVATLAATGLFVSTLVLRRWRPWVGLVLIPYALLLCADFTIRWRSTLLP